MELRHLKYFVTVADELHFGRAADRLHVAQPAVSAQIRHLEAELGVQLLRRSSRVVELTGAGAVLLADARRLLEQADSTTRAIRGWQLGAEARLRIGYSADTVPAALPTVLAAWRAEQPSLQVELRAAAPAELHADVRTDRLDAAVTTATAAMDGLRTTRAGHAGFVLARRSSATPGLREPVTALAELARIPLIVLARERGPATFDAIVAAFHSSGEVAGLSELDVTLEHLLMEVSAGAGAAIIPAAAARRLSAPGVEFAPIAIAGMAFELLAVTRDEVPSRAVLEFLRRFAVGSAVRPALVAA
jgi:DNA-binding transcriptional LysR family regulator